jgi:hypothetical protein
MKTTPSMTGGRNCFHQGRYDRGLVDVDKGRVAGHLKDFGAHALEGGEEEQGEADHEGGHEGLLPGQGFRGLNSEGPHGEGR